MKIFCAETLWDSNLTSKRISYKHLLELVANECGNDISYFTFNTPEELDHLFMIFKQGKYDIFYLASHMMDGNITSGFRKQFSINVMSLIKRNKVNLTGKILHLAGCSSMSENNIDISKVKKLCKLKIISGYSIDTDSTESSAMDLLYLVTLDREGIKDLPNKLTTRYYSLVKESGFKMYILKEIE